MSLKDNNLQVNFETIDEGELTLTDTVSVDIAVADILDSDMVLLSVTARVGGDSLGSYQAVITAGTGFSVVGGGADDVSVLAYRVLRLVYSLY